MTTRRAAARRVEEEIANAGVPPLDNQVSPQEQAPLGDQALVNPPFMTEGDIWTTFINFLNPMNTQAQAVSTQAQVVMAQANQ